MYGDAMKAGIVADAWKAETFRQILTEHGYTFEEASDKLLGIVFTVETDNLPRLAYVVKKSQKRCAELKN